MLSSEIGHRTTNTVIGSPIPVGTEPFGVAVTPDGSKVYVTNVRDNTVSVIDTTTNTVIGFPIPVGGNPVGAAVTPDGSRVYVTNAVGNTVSVNSPRSRRDGKSVEVTSARSRSSNSESWNAPYSSSVLMVGARSAVIQSRPAGFQHLLNARLGDHAAIADQHNEVETLLELGDLGSQRAGITGITREHFDRHRTAVTGAQQAEHDLQLVAFAVAAVAASRQRTGPALEPGRADVVEHQRAVARGSRCVIAG